jgi:AraC-like DNA-binding protein
MINQHSKASGVGLEPLGKASPADWLWHTAVQPGVEFLEARFRGYAYHKHRHDTYAICLTTLGIQAFEYRGAAEVSTPGQVVVLHPDELHDGHAETQEGFGYQIVYVEPALIFAAGQVICGRACPLPFVRTPVLTNPKLAAAVTGSFPPIHEPLALDSLIVQLAEGLIDADPNCRPRSPPRYLAVTAVERARQFLEAEKTRVVNSAELEAVTGLTRFELARHFRAICGTSPYRYLLMRRLDFARHQLAQRRPLVDIALEAGFADQAHFTRMFRAAFGLTPAQYAALQAQEVAKRREEPGNSSLDQGQS